MMRVTICQIRAGHRDAAGLPAGLVTPTFPDSTGHPLRPVLPRDNSSSWSVHLFTFILAQLTTHAHLAIMLYKQKPCWRVSVADDHSRMARTRSTCERRSLSCALSDQRRTGIEAVAGVSWSRSRSTT